MRKGIRIGWKFPPMNTLAIAPLSLLSVVIPARDEEGCIASTVEHLHVELRLRKVPHEIMVVDDGSTDATWKILTELVGHTSRTPPDSEQAAAWLWQRGCARP